jgi:hypothetical protein
LAEFVDTYCLSDRELEIQGKNNQLEYQVWACKTIMFRSSCNFVILEFLNNLISVAQEKS